MNRVDATSPVGEKAEPEKVPVKHPRWCDRSLCTAPEFMPTSVEKHGEKTPPAGAHRSADLIDFGACIAPDWRGRKEMYLQQTVMPWQTNTWLNVGESMILINHDSPLLWALLDERDEMEAAYPALMADGRAAAARRLTKVRATEAES